MMRNRRKNTSGKGKGKRKGKKAEASASGQAFVVAYFADFHIDYIGLARRCAA